MCRVLGLLVRPGMGELHRVLPLVGEEEARSHGWFSDPLQARPHYFIKNSYILGLAQL